MAPSNENREPIKIEDIRPNPLITAFLEVFGEELDHQIDLLEAKGARIRKAGIIYQSPDTPDHTS